MLSKPLQRSLELLDPLLHGDVERGQRPRRHRARRRQAMPRLEALQRLDHGRRQARRLPCRRQGRRSSISRLRRRSSCCPCDADREFCVGRDGRPAAAHRDVGIAERGLLDPLRRAFVKGRLMRQRQRCGRTRFRRGGGGGLLCRRRVRGDRRGLGRDAALCQWPPGGLSANAGAAASIDGNGQRSSFFA